MTRMSDGDEDAREKKENAAAYLAGALKYIEFIQIRLERAAVVQSGLLNPALDDLNTIKTKLSKAQRIISQF